MKELKKSLLYVGLSQLICWLTFMMIDEFSLINKTIRENIAVIYSIVLALTIVILYFVFIKKILKKDKLNSLRFNIFITILWIVFSIGITYVSLALVDYEILHVCTGTGWECFFNGIEYALHGLCLLSSLALIIIIKLLKYLYDLIFSK